MRGPDRPDVPCRARYTGSQLNTSAETSRRGWTPGCYPNSTYYWSPLGPHESSAREACTLPDRRHAVGGRILICRGSSPVHRGSPARCSGLSVRSEYRPSSLAGPASRSTASFLARSCLGAEEPVRNLRFYPWAKIRGIYGCRGHSAVRGASRLCRSHCDHGSQFTGRPISQWKAFFQRRSAVKRDLA